MRFIRDGVHFYLIGLIILSLGIALAVMSMLGASPYDALLVGLYRTFGFTIGSWEIVVGFLLVMGNAIAARKRPEYFALITSFITGVGIDSWMFILKFIYVPEAWLGQSIFIILSVILTGLGIALNLQSQVAPNPMDRSMLVVSELTGWNVTISRAAISVILVITAFFFSGAIGIGTLLHAVFTGMFINFFFPFVIRLRKASLEKWSEAERQLAK